MEYKILALSVILILAFSGEACGIELTVSGGEAGEEGSVTTKIGASKEASVNGEITIDGARISPVMFVNGPLSLFEQTHGVRDSTGKSASVYVRVVNAPDGLNYFSRVLPQEGSVSAQPWVSAEQWLTVPRADSIKCTASASYGTLSASTGIEETKGPQADDYVSLNGYYGKAYSSEMLVYALQTEAEGSADSIDISSISSNVNETPSVDTQMSGISGERAVISWLDSIAYAGNITQASQEGHLQGEFTSTATSGGENITRTSSYGTEYDLGMRAINGTSPTGTVGFYVNPSATNSTFGEIQGAVNASEPGDTVNLNNGTYIENVHVDKSLSIKGIGANGTIIDGNRSGSVFVIGQNDTNISVELSAMTIQGGSGTSLLTESNDTNDTALFGGGILNYGNLAVEDANISGNTADYGGGIANFGTAAIVNSNISANDCLSWRAIYNPYGDGNAFLGSGGGIFNYIGSNLTVTDSTINGNEALGVGGGIYNLGTAVVTNSTISQNSVYGERSEMIYGYGGGIYNGGYYNNSTFQPGHLVVTNSTISGNYADYGGGIANSGTANIAGSNITQNAAYFNGGGIGNYGRLNFSTGTFTPATLNVTDTNVSENRAMLGGGISNSGSLFLDGASKIVNNRATTSYGGGIYSANGSMVTFNGTEIAVSSNRAHLPSPSEQQLAWYRGWGVYMSNGTPITAGGFDPATQVTSNSYLNSI